MVANCKMKMKENQIVVKCLKENVNFMNFFVDKLFCIVYGIKPQAWQRLTNGLNCSKTDMVSG